MKTNAQAVVIGGGLIGCSILYHLTKLGWKDVVLCERDELTSGSTWHAAANIHGLHDNNNISKLQYYTMKIYKELEKETEQSCGIYTPGSLYLAQSEEREHQLRIQAAKARYFGIDFYELSVKEAQDYHPLVNYDDIRCIMFEPDGGNVDPSGVTHAYAKGARMNGGKIYRFTPVIDTIQQSNGSWHVITEKGTIHTDIIINAAGLWGREVAKMAGIELPLMPTEHQYFVTEDIADIAKLDKRLPSVADRDGEYYLRQEGLGLLVGAYERDVRLWSEHGTPSDFGHDLLDDDLERISDNVMQAFHRIPALENIGIKRIINGPMIWAPDSAALFGPVPEVKNYFCCNGIIPGFSQSGGLGLSLAQWIVNGEPEYDMFSWDLTRYGHWANKDFTTARVKDSYAHRFKIHFPFEERDAGRPVRTRPLYDKQKEMGAVFGLNYGWEHPLWFAQSPNNAYENYGFTRQEWFDKVGEEALALRHDVGIIDISNFAKYHIYGKGSADWLDKIFANKIPRVIGRSCLTPLLGTRGGIAGDFTITMLGDDNYLMVGSGMAERYHTRYWQMVSRPNSVCLDHLTESHVAYNIAGPKSRQLLQHLTNNDMSNDAFPFMRSQKITVAGIDVTALRVSFTGDLGWELYIKQDQQIELYNILLQEGQKFGLRPVGSRALMSLRLEKGYGSWGREYSPEYWPQEVGLDRLVKDKTEFIGRDAWLSVKDKKPREKMVLLEIDVTHDADASGGEPIFTKEGAAVGRISSGAYGYYVEKSLALGFIKTEYLNHQHYDVAILGIPHHAKILNQTPFDPDGIILRG